MEKWEGNYIHEHSVVGVHVLIGKEKKKKKNMDTCKYNGVNLLGTQHIANEHSPLQQPLWATWIAKQNLQRRKNWDIKKLKR